MRQHDTMQNLIGIHARASQYCQVLTGFVPCCAVLCCAAAEASQGVLPHQACLAPHPLAWAHPRLAWGPHTQAWGHHHLALGTLACPHPQECRVRAQCAVQHRLMLLCCYLAAHPFGTFFSREVSHSSLLSFCADMG
jgi:hypothetical protein